MFLALIDGESEQQAGAKLEVKIAPQIQNAGNFIPIVLKPLFNKRYSLIEK